MLWTKATLSSSLSLHTLRIICSSLGIAFKKLISLGKSTVIDMRVHAIKLGALLANEGGGNHVHESRCRMRKDGSDQS